MKMATELLVPAEVMSELTQILSNLFSGDNELRRSVEKALDERVAHNPELYLSALAQSAISAEEDSMRSFSLVLLRRLLPRNSPQQPSKLSNLTLYDHFSSQGLVNLEHQLLHSLSHERSNSVRRNLADTICDVANSSMHRGRPWHALQAQAFAMTQSEDPDLRESAYRVFSGCPKLITDLHHDGILEVFHKGLQDTTSVKVRHAALQASVSFLTHADSSQLIQCRSLLHPMLETLLLVPSSDLQVFLRSLTPLCTSHPTLFKPHLSALFSFLTGLILLTADPGPTPTVARPFPSIQSMFSFPPSINSAESSSVLEEDQEKDGLREAALEFMISLSEADPSMVKKQDGWVGVIVRGCLEGMGEFSDDVNDLQSWLDADPSDDPTDEPYPHVYEQALDRLACALGGKSVLPLAFQYIPSMLASYDWRLRHAGLIAISAIGEGTSKVMETELGTVVDLIIPMFRDSNPRVRHAACQCVGQLCTDLEEVMQERYHQQLFGALIPTLEAPEPRVHSHAAAALINVCEGVERDKLLPYLDPIVERLLKLLNPIIATNNPPEVKYYVLEQAITTLAMVADASEASFTKHYSSIMPLLLKILRNSGGPNFRKLRVKAMECAGLIAIAVGRDVFREDANTLIQLLIQIQNSPIAPDDTLLSRYLTSTWAKICQALGPGFEPYLPVVMPPLLEAARANAEAVSYPDDEQIEESLGEYDPTFTTRLSSDIRTTIIEEKCQAFETLLIYSTTLGAKFAPFFPQGLEITIASLRFYFHDGIRETCAMLIPPLLICGKDSGTLTSQMISATFAQLVDCIGIESDASFLSSLYGCLHRSLAVIGGPNTLPAEFYNSIIEATKHQLQALADRRKHRANRPMTDLQDDQEELTLIQEMEDFALEDMGKLLRYFDPNHPLLIAVSSVKDLGLTHLENGSDGEE